MVGCLLGVSCYKWCYCSQMGAYHLLKKPSGTMYELLPNDSCQLGGVGTNVLAIVTQVSELCVEPALPLVLEPQRHGIGLFT